MQLHRRISTVIRTQVSERDRNAARRQAVEPTHRKQQRKQHRSNEEEQHRNKWRNIGHPRLVQRSKTTGSQMFFTFAWTLKENLSLARTLATCCTRPIELRDELSTQKFWVKSFLHPKSRDGSPIHRSHIEMFHSQYLAGQMNARLSIEKLFWG